MASHTQNDQAVGTSGFKQPPLHPHSLPLYQILSVRKLGCPSSLKRATIFNLPSSLCLDECSLAPRKERTDNIRHFDMSLTGSGEVFCIFTNPYSNLVMRERNNKNTPSTASPHHVGVLQSARVAAKIPTSWVAMTSEGGYHRTQ